jgi:ribosomal protein S18 acetylase RimI-like enzyme
VSDAGEVEAHSEAEAAALIAQGAVLVRNAHQMRLRLPHDTSDDPEIHSFSPDANPPAAWIDALPAFLAAYPPDHPDHLPGGAGLIESYLVPYTAGAKLGALICSASGFAVRHGYPYAGILVVDRPGEGAWVCDIWRDPDPSYAGAGTRLLRWSASRLDDFTSVGLAVTVGNDRARRTYERVGFTIESTAWRLTMP